MVLLGIAVLLAAEIAALVSVAARIGVLPAIGLLVVVSLCGPWLVRRAGLGVWRRARASVATGAAPDRALLDGVLLLLAGLLICIPGFVTDAAGILLLLPAVRAALRRRIARRAAKSVIWRLGSPGVPGAGRWFRGDEIIEASSHGAGGAPRSEAPGPLREAPGSFGDAPGPLGDAPGSFGDASGPLGEAR